MSAAFYVSYVALWLLLLCQGVLLILVYRHFGLLALNTAAGVQHDGLPIGAEVPDIEATSTTGQTVQWRSPPAYQHLLAFVSPDCGPCTKVLPTLMDLARTGERLVITMIVPGPPDVARRLVEQFQPPETALCVSDPSSAITAGFRVRVTPFFILLGPDGRVVAKGLCDTVARLENLLAVGGIAVPEPVVSSSSAAP